MCAATSGGGFDLCRQSFAFHQLHVLSIFVIVLKAPQLPVTHRHIQYTAHTHTHWTHTSTTIATIPALSHVVYHSDSPYHTVIATILIVFPTVILSAYPVQLKLSSGCTLLLSCRLIYFLGRTYGSHTVSYHLKYKAQSEHLNSHSDQLTAFESDDRLLHCVCQEF